MYFQSIVKRFSKTALLMMLSCWMGCMFIGSNFASAEQRDFRRGKDLASRRGLDNKLRRLLRKNNVEAIATPIQKSEQVLLGQKLFFDRILSGNYDTACATCHHPLTATSDGVSLGVGTGTPTVGEVGVLRSRGEGRSFVPRNSPDIFNRGSELWHNIYWDARIEISGGVISSPAGTQLPSELITPLQIQAMFPVTSRVEMRGSRDDVNQGNELAAIEDTNFTGIWSALMDRLMGIEEYRKLFSEAFPSVPTSSLGFQHAAIAIAAFEAEAFGIADSPFDRYLAGDRTALDDDEKRGAILFYGRANCSSCHSGSLMTDQKLHNLAVIQLGPGKNASGLDFGRGEVTGDTRDQYKYRTPPLRNVTQTGPWMHNGAFSNLTDAILHHLIPKDSLEDYDPDAQIFQPEVRDLVWQERDLREILYDGFSEYDSDLKDEEIPLLLKFLNSLTSDNLHARLQAVIPSSVPSGLLEDGVAVSR
ncbi:MAG: cytochrome-c peroxidase [Rubripirellula sp.]